MLDYVVHRPVPHCCTSTSATLTRNRGVQASHTAVVHALILLFAERCRTAHALVQNSYGITHAILLRPVHSCLTSVVHPLIHAAVAHALMRLFLFGLPSFPLSLPPMQTDCLGLHDIR